MMLPLPERWLMRSLLWQYMVRVIVVPKLHHLSSLPARATVLEVGCGSGFAAREILRRRDQWHMALLDLDGSALCGARAQTRRFRSRARLIQADASALPFGGSSFDVVICLGVLHHLADWDAALTGMAKLVRPGGCLVIADLFARFFRGPMGWIFPPVSRYDRHDLLCALQCADLQCTESEFGRSGYIMVIRNRANATRRRSDMREPTSGRGVHGPLRLRGHIRMIQAYRRDPLRFFSDLQQCHGDIVKFRLAWYHIFLISHPDLVCDVLVRNAGKFRKGLGGQMARRLLGNGLITNEGESHSHQRGVILPLFKPARIRDYVPAMVQVVLERTAAWESGLPIAIDEEMAWLTLAVVGRVFFARDVAAEAPLITRAMSAASDAFVQLSSARGRVTEHLPFSWARRFRAERAALYAYLDRIIDERLSAAVVGDDAISLLAMASDVTGSPLSRRQIRDELVTLILAGHETTTQLLSWIWYLLARNPTARERLCAEVDALASPAELLGADDLNRMPYTTAVVREVLRLYPPVYSLGRRAKVDHVLSGQRIRARSLVVMSPWVVHRDARWYRGPEVFDPERWLGSEERSRYAFFPFGGGPRSCLGEALVWTEVPLIVAVIARSWRLDPLPGRLTVEPVAHVSLRPRGGMQMTPEFRRKCGTGRSHQLARKSSMTPPRNPCGS